jgi:hypothetical protein
MKRTHLPLIERAERARDPQGVIRTICEDRRNGATRWRGAGEVMRCHST